MSAPPPPPPPPPVSSDALQGLRDALSVAGDRLQYIEPEPGGPSGLDSRPMLKAKGKADQSQSDYKTLLVIDYSTQWEEKFRGAKLNNGSRIKVEQAGWADISLVASSEGGVRLYLDRSENPTFCVPDFMLIRNFPTDLHGKNYGNILMGLMFANVQSCNSLMSIFMGMNRPLVYAEMLKIGRTVSRSRSPLPLVPMTFFPNTHSKCIDFSGTHEVEYPCVVKVSSPHAGYGKARAMNKSEYEDIHSILALHSDYYTTEPFCGDVDFEFRIQKIGTHYRGFKRNSDSGWKNNWGNLQFADYELEARHIEWIDSASQLWGGLDILALDVLRLKDGREVILELNDTANGLMWEHEAEDCGYIREVVLQRMNQAFGFEGPETS